MSIICDISYKGEAVLKAGNPSEKIFAGRFFDEDGYELNEIIGIWSLMLPSELEDCDKIVVSYYPNNKIGLKASEKANRGSTLILKLIGEHAEFGYFETNLEVKIGDLW